MKVQQSSIFIQSAHRSSSNDLDRIIRGRSQAVTYFIGYGDTSLSRDLRDHVTLLRLNCEFNTRR